MSSTNWEVLTVVQGDLQAEILRGLLNAQGVDVVLSQEGAGKAYGLFAGPLGEVQILVPAENLDLARQVLEDSYTGAFEAEENLESGDAAEDSEIENTSDQEDQPDD